MIRVCVEVRGGDDSFEVAMSADSISQAVDMARGRFPGHDVRVVFPIDGEEFFGERGTGAADTQDPGQPTLVPDRVS